ncbi:MAG TPA: hypothetical protein VJ764_05295 [Steroidobacteraceae bacterium]|nr:hypothetical protein [Steroidobacteraceae bacterium]
MAQRRKGQSDNPSGKPRTTPEKRPTDPANPRGGERDAGRSWVHDEPQLEQDDDPQRSGYSDRETPEADRPASQPGKPGERPRPTR